MRIDRHLTALTAPTHAQRYFLSCWFNLVHEYSLDSFRVRVMNPGTMLREIQGALAFTEAKPEEKSMILEEAKHLLDADHVLARDPFAPVMARLKALLSGLLTSYTSKNGAAKGPEERLLIYTINELQPLVHQHYTPTAFALLEDLLVTQAEQGHAPDLAVVHSITGALLSTLLDRDFSIESLYQIYAQVLVPRKPGKTYCFDRKLGLTGRLMTQPEQAFDVTFALDQITKPEEIPAELGPLAISDMPPFALDAKHAKTSYLSPVPKRRFVTIRNLLAADRRAAGLRAYEQLSNVINLLRFEYEQAKLQIPDQFAVLEVARPTAGARVYPLPRVVPNPTLSLNGNDAADFVASVNELIGGPHFSDEGRDRITSAFRLYRQGRDQDTIEAKLVHWWTALEYLVRGSQVGSGIGKSVEASLAPVIGLSYFPKLLIVMRNLLIDHGVGLTDAEGSPVDLRASSLTTLWDLYKQTDQQDVIHKGLAAEPFLQVQVQQILGEMATSKALRERLNKHEQRVRWQIQRLWRTRCDIVHSAGRGANHLLLCSNLEYYLKTTLHGLLGALRTVPTLSGPHEYFDRAAYRYGRILQELQDGQDGELRSSLPS